MVTRHLNLLRRTRYLAACSRAPLAIGTQILGSIVNVLASELLAIVDGIIALHDTLALIMTSLCHMARLACYHHRHFAKSRRCHLCHHTLICPRLIGSRKRGPTSLQMRLTMQ